jgi:hypothetical protein
MRIIIRHSLVLASIFFTSLPGYAAELTQRNRMITLALSLGGGMVLLSLADWQIECAQASARLNLEQHNQPATQDLYTLKSLLAAFGIER